MDKAPIHVRSLGVLVWVAFLATLSPLSAGAHQSTGYTDDDLERYIELWGSRDGLASFVLSDRFCEFLVVRPSHFLETMVLHEAVLDEWLSELAGLSFVDRGGCLDRNCMKRLMIASLEHLEVSGEASEARDLVLETLRDIEVRIVD
jgi:hypothetical protein